MNFHRILYINKKGSRVDNCWESYTLSIIASNKNEINNYIQKRLGHQEFHIQEDTDFGECMAISDELLEKILIQNIPISRKIISDRDEKELEEKKHQDFLRERSIEDEKQLDMVIGPIIKEKPTVETKELQEKNSKIKKLVQEFKKTYM